MSLHWFISVAKTYLKTFSLCDSLSGLDTGLKREPLPTCGGRSKWSLGEENRDHNEAGTGALVEEGCLYHNNFFFLSQ